MLLFVACSLFVMDPGHAVYRINVEADKLAREWADMPQAKKAIILSDYKRLIIEFFRIKSVSAYTNDAAGKVRGKTRGEERQASEKSSQISSSCWIPVISRIQLSTEASPTYLSHTLGNIYLVYFK